ncbi:MAG TPA: NAD(+)/NADH kinase [Ktedonobacterales bacterium]
MSQTTHPAIRSAGIIYRERSVEAHALALTLLQRLSARGLRTWAADRDATERILDQLPGTDLSLVLGGDGTILSVARLCAPLGIPILGVNFGRVGFLTELEPAEVEEKLPLYLAGDYWVDERSMLVAELPAGPRDDQRDEQRLIALNDIVLVRGAEPRVIRVGIWVDGHHYNTTVADGVIVSTATGSTAYNLAAGGPIMHPQVKSCVITPIAPHLAADRSLVLEPTANIALELDASSAAGILSADGQINRDFAPGSRVVIHTDAYVTRFLRRRPATSFYRILSAKLRDNL